MKPHRPCLRSLWLRQHLTGLLAALVFFAGAAPALPTPFPALPLFYAPEQPVNESHPFQFFKSLAHQKRLAQGQLLIATPQIAEGTFFRSVILLLDYHLDGAMGLILNRPTDVPLVEVLPEVDALQERPEVLHFGGPVSKNQVFLLHGTPGLEQEHSAPLIDGVYLGGNPDILQQVLQDGSGNPHFRVYAGYAGWAAGQLDREVLRGDWQVHWADAATVFEKSPIVMWKELLFLSESHWAQRPTLPFPPAPATVTVLGERHQSAPESPELPLGSRSPVSCQSPQTRL